MEKANKDAIYWWETKRVFYNSILIALIFYILDHYTVAVDRIGYKNALLWNICYIFVANVLYSLGWILEINVTHKEPLYALLNENRWYTYWVGTLFSVVLTWFLYAISLSPFEAL